MKKSAKFNLQIQYNATIQRKYRLNSPYTYSAIDNARQANSVMLNATLIAQCENSQLFRYQTSPFQLSRATIPQKSKRVNSKEIVQTPKLNFPYP